MVKIKKRNVKPYILPFLVLCLGIFLRVFYLGQIPGGYHRDEAYGAWNAFALFHDGIDSSGHSWPVYFEAWAHGQNALNSYFMLPFIALTGGHITPVVVRLPQVIVSVLTLAAVYVLLRMMFTEKLALWGLFLLSVCPWHVMMSRWGLESNLAPGFLIMGLCFFILGLEKAPLLIVSALCYGLSLYCYATIWPIVPVMLLLQLAYAAAMGKFKGGGRKTGSCLAVAGAVLAALALPLVLFLLVNMGYLPELKIGCFSIYRMSEFRGNELAHSLGEIWNNIKNTGYLLKHQDVGRPYDVIMPYGFFYDVGRVFILIGVPVVLCRTVRGLLQRRFVYEWFLTVQLIGAGIVGCLVSVTMTQINCLYIPLILCEAVGVEAVASAAGKLAGRAAAYMPGGICGGGRARAAGQTGGRGPVQAVPAVTACLIAAVYLWNLLGFQRAYYTDYREMVSAQFQEGADAAVRYAAGMAKEYGMDVGINEGLKYPNILLATETTAGEYLDTLVYSDFRPAPARFSKDGVTYHMGINYDSPEADRVYVLYYTDVEYFSEFKLINFMDWYVAVPDVTPCEKGIHSLGMRVCFPVNRRK